MTIAEVLAANLTALIGATPDFSEHRLSLVAKVPKTTVRRMRLAEADARIDSVESVAKAFRLRACDLLDPALKDRVASGEALGLIEARPPVVEESRWRTMSPRARALVEDICQRSIAGSVDDSAITLLHDTLQRLGPRA